MARPKGDIEPRILQAAAERFATHGVDATSLRSIAKDARTSIGMVYYYFPTKDDLFFAVIEEVYAQLLADLAHALAKGRPFEERVRRFYERLGALSPEEGRIVRLVILEGITNSARFTRLIERFKRGHIALVLQLVDDGLLQKSLRTDLHPFVLGTSIVALGAVPQLVSRLASGHLPIANVERSSLLQQLMDVLFNGVAPKPPTVA